MGDETLLILRDVNFSLREGEFVAIEGRSGSGKSTMLHVLGALDAADTGRLEFEEKGYGPDATTRTTGITFPVWSRGIEVAAAVLVVLVAGALTPVALYQITHAFIFSAIAGIIVGLLLGLALVSTYFGCRSYVRERPTCDLRTTKFGFVFQFYYLLPEFNVLENTLLSPMIEWSWLGYRKQRRQLVERATKILTDLGLSHRLHHKPNQLSGGERQRVAIARALMNNPRILFADEPTGNLDYETGRQIMGVLEKLHRENGQTIVMVTHDRALARQTDRVLVLVNGKLERPGEEKSGADKGAMLDYSKE